MNFIKTFVPKFANDWAINLAGMLTFSLITAIVPLLVAMLSLAGLVLNLLSPSSFQQIAVSIGATLPPGTGKIIDVRKLLENLVQITGPLAIISLFGLIFTGSNLFANVENAFCIVFRVPDRDIIPQRVMAIGMIFILAVLLPAAIIASSLVAAGQQLFTAILPKPFAVVLSVLGPLTSIFILWLLFLSIYMIVPNIKVEFRDAWRGALTAAILMAIASLIFPLYSTLFLVGNEKYGASFLLVLVLIIYLWFFNVILMIGAEVNSVVMGLEATPYDLPRTFADDYHQRIGQARAPRPQKRRPPLPLPQPQQVAAAGHAVGAGASTLWRLVSPLLRILALVGWLVARPTVRAEERDKR